jgi:hypothetical protein
MVIKFEEHEDYIEVIDPVERHRERILVEESSDFGSLEWEHDPYPVDNSIRMRTSSFALQNTEYLNIRKPSGEVVSEVGPKKTTRLPIGEQILEVSRSMKIYIEISSSGVVESGNSKKSITLGEASTVAIGARSHHTQAANTIKTTTSPTDVMKAVSTFGSALKAMGPERSYSTLRGHPPLLERDKKLDIPQALRWNETPIKIEVPPTLKHVYVVAPLAYYLGAEVIPGPEPRLVLNSKRSIRLGDGDEFEDSIGRALKRIFFLDCVLRTGDRSPGTVHEQLAVEPHLGFEVSKLYSCSLTEQIEAYFEVPFSAIESQYPKWDPKTIIKPNENLIEFLPFIANNLSIVATETKSRHTPARREPRKSIQKPSMLCDQIAAPTVRQSWDCNSESQIVSTVPLSAFNHGTDRDLKDEPLKIQVICNDRDMREELIAAYSAYGDRDALPFDVSVHYDLTMEELRRVFKTHNDFTHYIGHVDANGFRCTDGNIGSDTLDTVNTDMFFLNACQSSSQGIDLINAGSIGGIVTYDEVQNHCAVEIGSTVARLLNLGYPLYAAVDIARIKSPAGNQYHLVGDGSMSIAQPSTVIPNSCRIMQKDDGRRVVIDLYMSKKSPKGSVFLPNIDSIEEYHLVQQNVGPRSVSKAELIKFLDIDPIPVIIDGSVHWSDEIHIADIFPE